MAASTLAVSCDVDSPLDKKYHTAYIQKMSGRDSLSIKICERGLYMVHDPISLFFGRRHYLDSIFFFVPDKQTKFFRFDEVQLSEDGHSYYLGHYPIVKGGITLGSDSLKIDLTFYDFDDKVTSGPTQNGTYLLKDLRR
jgi:hypothetical protein